jgi:hypothetical protein
MLRSPVAPVILLGLGRLLGLTVQVAMLRICTERLSPENFAWVAIAQGLTPWVGASDLGVGAAVQSTSSVARLEAHPWYRAVGWRLMPLAARRTAAFLILYGMVVFGYASSCVGKRGADFQLLLVLAIVAPALLAIGNLSSLTYRHLWVDGRASIPLFANITIPLLAAILAAGIMPNVLGQDTLHLGIILAEPVVHAIGHSAIAFWFRHEGAAGGEFSDSVVRTVKDRAAHLHRTLLMSAIILNSESFFLGRLPSSEIAQYVIACKFLTPGYLLYGTLLQSSWRAVADVMTLRCVRVERLIASVSAIGVVAVLLNAAVFVLLESRLRAVFYPALGVRVLPELVAALTLYYAVRSICDAFVLPYNILGATQYLQRSTTLHLGAYALGAVGLMTSDGSAVALPLVFTTAYLISSFWFLPANLRRLLPNRTIGAPT